MSRQFSDSATKRGPASLILQRDRTHLLHADWCELDAGVVTCTTPYGIRSWPMRELVEVRWRASKEVGS